MWAATLMLEIPPREEDLVSGALVPLTIVKPRIEARWDVSSGAAGACHPEAV